MGLHKILDAEYPPPYLPPGVTGVALYAGGALAARVTPVPEWLRFAHVAQLPFWVPDLGLDPRAQAVDATDTIRRLGWAPFMPEPGRRAILTDEETSADRAWYATWASSVYAAGFISVCYGSLSTVLENAAEYVLAAGWDDQVNIPAGQTIVGHQYAANVSFAGTKVDYSVIDDWLYLRAGVGPRHG